MIPSEMPNLVNLLVPLRFVLQYKCFGLLSNIQDINSVLHIVHYEKRVFIFIKSTVWPHKVDYVYPRRHSVFCVCEVNFQN